MAFTVIVVGDPVLASVAMGNWRNVNYGNALLPVDATGNGVNNTIAAGSSSYRFSNTYSVLGNFSGQITSTLITGTAPFSIASTTKVANLNADFLDDQTGSYYQNSDNQSAGTLPTGRLAGSYTGITAVGTLNQNAFNIAPSSGDTTFTLGQGGAYTAVYYGIGAGTSSGFQLAIYGAQNKQSGSAVDCGYIQFKHEESSADNKCMMEFWTHNGTSVANRLTLSSNGALTGSSSDASAFDLTWRNTHATGLSRIIVQTNTSAQNAQLVSDVANTRSAVGSSSGGSNWIYFTNSNQIQMVSNGTERARLGSNFDLGANKLLFGSAIGTNTANLYASSGDLKTDDSLNVVGDIYTTAWTDYSGSTTLAGFSSAATLLVTYKKIGKFVFVHFVISGTSNATTFTFTVPNASANASIPFHGVGTNVINNTVASATPAWIVMSANTNIIQIFRDGILGTTWTSSGLKQAAGQFFYEAAA